MSKSLKFGIILLGVFCLALVVVTLAGIPLGEGLAETSEPEPTAVVPPYEGSEADLIQAVEKAVSTAAGRWALFEFKIDHIQVQDDGQAALVWLRAVEIESGKSLGREPELALAELAPDGTWQVFLEDGESFDEKFPSFQYASKSVEGDLLDEDRFKPKSTRVFGGYYLPWAAELEKRLTWSVGHTSCYPIYYCTHAFDFADGTMFPLVAAKGGTVFHWKDTCANGDPYCTNSITLQDRSTTPWTYQLYLHIAKDSVPDHLKKVGTPVLQGQYIADVDDTGYSTGHHVHFMVVSEETRYTSGNGYVWGVAEDITFRDVDINWDPETQGGRPRLAYEAETYGGEGRTYYISGNEPANPPTGALTAPSTKILVTDPILTVSGNGADDIAVTKYEILAEYDEEWVSIGEVAGGKSFSTTINLCETAIPDGPFNLALRVWDYEGNTSGAISIRRLVKDLECETAGEDPVVHLVRHGGLIALPQKGFVSANVSEGSTDSEILYVDFWFHGRNWTRDDWVYLGQDTNGTNGWQAFINTTGELEGENYTVVAVVTDAAGNMSADVAFNAVVDRTSPWVLPSVIASPAPAGKITLTWDAGDNLAGLGRYALEVKVSGGEYHLVEDAIPGTAVSYTFSVEAGQLIYLKLTAFDNSGNSAESFTQLYTEGYEFPYWITFPLVIEGGTE